MLMVPRRREHDPPTRSRIPGLQTSAGPASGLQSLQLLQAWDLNVSISRIMETPQECQP